MPTAIREDRHAAVATSVASFVDGITTETKVRNPNPDWDDDRVAREVAGIQVERGMPVPDPTTFTG